MSGKSTCENCLVKFKPKKAWGSVAKKFLNRNVDYLTEKSNKNDEKKLLSVYNFILRILNQEVVFVVIYVVKFKSIIIIVLVLMNLNQMN